MAQFFQIHPDNPQQRLILQTMQWIRRGGIVAYPTDSFYVLGCGLGCTDALARIRQLTEGDDYPPITLISRGIADIAQYAKVDNAQYRVLKTMLPGCCTIVLKASKAVPKPLQHPKTKTIGFRVPDHPIVSALLNALEEPMWAVTLRVAGCEDPWIDPMRIRERFEDQIDLILDGGYCGIEEMRVVDLSQGQD